MAKSSEWSSETVALDAYLWVLGLSVAHVTYVTHAIAEPHILFHISTKSLSLSTAATVFHIISEFLGTSRHQQVKDLHKPCQSTDVSFPQRFKAMCLPSTPPSTISSAMLSQ